MTRDPDMIRVSKRQLKRIFGRSLAKPLLEQHLAELEAAPEGEIPRGKPSDEARTLAHMDFGTPRRKQA